MNEPGGPAAPGAPSAGARIDRAFVDEHGLLERYLDGKLPFKGQRDFEHWCAEHPDYLEERGLAGRAQASLKLLEAAGRPADLAEPGAPWWRAEWLRAVTAGLLLASVFAIWALAQHLSLLRSELDAARARLIEGPMLPAASRLDLKVAPDRAPGIDQAGLTVDHAKPTLVHLSIDMNYARAQRFRVAIDAHDRGPMLEVKDLIKDSAGQLNLSFNSSAFPAGRYDLRIEALPLLGAPIADGWLILTVR